MTFIHKTKLGPNKFIEKLSVLDSWNAPPNVLSLVFYSVNRTHFSSTLLLGSVTMVAMKGFYAVTIATPHLIAFRVTHCVFDGCFLSFYGLNLAFLVFFGAKTVIGTD